MGKQREKEYGFRLLFRLKQEVRGGQGMRKGKLQQSVLVRSVFKMLGQKREDAAGPAVGRGVSAIEGEKETQVFSCAPVLVKDPEDAVLAVCRVCNSVAAAGASAKGVLVSLMLPEAMEEKDLKELMRVVDGACVRYGTAVIGGHTEVTDGVSYPVLTVTAAGGTTRAGLFDPSCVTADLDLVVTKGIALGAVSYLAKTRRDELLTRFSPGFIHGAADFSEDYSVCREAEIAVEHGAAAMQDLSEGGIFGALWEMADGAGVGLDAENFDVEDLDAGGLQIGFDFTDHGRVADHVVLRFGRGGGHEADADVAVARLGGAEHLIGGRDVENGESGKADRTRKLQRLVVAVLERDGGDLRRGGVAPETGSGGDARGGSTLKEAAAIRKHDVFLLG